MHKHARPSLKILCWLQTLPALLHFTSLQELEVRAADERLFPVLPWMRGRLSSTAALPALEYLSTSSGGLLLHLMIATALPVLRTLMVRQSPQRFHVLWKDLLDSHSMTGFADEINCIVALKSLRALTLCGTFMFPLFLNPLSQLTKLDVSNALVTIWVLPEQQGYCLLKELHLRWTGYSTTVMLSELAKLPQLQLLRICGVAPNRGQVPRLSPAVRAIAGSVANVALFALAPVRVTLPVYALQAVLAERAAGRPPRPQTPSPAQLAGLEAELVLRGCRLEYSFQ